MYQNVPDMESSVRKININLDATNCVGYGQCKQPHYQLGDDMCYCIYTCNGMKIYKDCSSVNINDFNHSMCPIGDPSKFGDCNKLKKKY